MLAMNSAKNITPPKFPSASMNGMINNQILLLCSGLGGGAHNIVFFYRVSGTKSHV